MDGAVIVDVNYEHQYDVSYVRSNSVWNKRERNRILYLEYLVYIVIIML